MGNPKYALQHIDSIPHTQIYIDLLISIEDLKATHINVCNFGYLLKETFSHAISIVFIYSW